MAEDIVSQKLHGHTEGEWSRENLHIVTKIDNPATGTRFKALLVASARRVRIGTDEVISQEQAEANAQLMAAAPDLLAACVEMICTLQIECGHYRCMNDAGETRMLEDAFGEEIEKMDAAIRKAGFEDQP